MHEADVPLRRLQKLAVPQAVQHMPKAGLSESRAGGDGEVK